MSTADESVASPPELRQERLSRFGRVLAITGLVYVGVHFVFSLWLHQSLFDLEVLPEVIATAAFSTLWLSLRGTPRSPTFVRAIELGSLFVGTWGFAGCAVVLPLVAQPESVVRGSLTYVLLAYAAYVPSTAKRTFVVALAMTVPLLTCIYIAYSSYESRYHDPPAATWPPVEKGAFAMPVTLYCLVWWSVAVAIATGFSRAIYGLRKEVEAAREDVKKLGQYTLEKPLGEGGMGVVYRASHAMLRRPTAVKLLLPDRSGADALARFEREVRRTAMLTHPNTITVYDYGRTDQGVFYYAMELLDGVNLQDLVELTGPMNEARVIHLLAQAAGSLGEAHDAGLIHRDIKPGNIMVVDRGGVPDLVKVMDFGLVKDVGPTTTDANGRTQDAPLTAQNTITGTPLYLAPETITDPDGVDARADIYALGAVGYWLLTGTHVFGGRSVVEVCSHHLHTKPERPSARKKSAVDADLEELLLSCLAKDPKGRPATAQALREKLLACRAAGTWTAPSASAWWKENRGALAGEEPRPIQVNAFGSTIAVSLERAETETVS
jgi:serine/threonine-protein kinase